MNFFIKNTSISFQNTLDSESIRISITDEVLTIFQFQCAIELIPDSHFHTKRTVEVTWASKGHSNIPFYIR